MPRTRVPGADFTVYNKIIIDPIQVAFHKEWDKKSTVYKQKLTTAQLETIKQRLGKLAEETFADVFSKNGGLQVVTAPGPDVLRFSVGHRRPVATCGRHAGAGP